MALNTPAEKKRGNKSWRPAKMLQVKGKKDGYVYRWCDKDAARLQRHQSNGWFPVSKLSGHSKTEHTAADKSEQTSITEYRELVLQAMPADEYEEHREYYREQNEQGLKALRRQLDKDLESVRPGLSSKLTGKITIE
jgi:hypothetical protein